MKLILALLLAVAGTSAFSQPFSPLPAPSASKPANLPLEKAYGPRQAIQIDLAASMSSPVLYFTIEGKTLI